MSKPGDKFGESTHVFTIKYEKSEVNARGLKLGTPCLKLTVEDERGHASVLISQIDIFIDRLREVKERLGLA